MHVSICISGNVPFFRFNMKAGSVGGKEHNLGMVLLPLPTLVFHRFALAYVILSSFGTPKQASMKNVACFTTSGQLAFESPRQLKE